MITDHLKLCLVTHIEDTPFCLYEQFILQAIAGGVTSIQLREKSKNKQEISTIALRLKQLLNHSKIPLIVNDHIDIAKEVDADGIHLGQSDYSPLDARKILGNNKIIGWSIESLAQLEIANQLTCIDYVGASAIFPSKSKSNCKTIWGLNGLRKISSLSKHPVVAIGGINQNNIRNVIASGASGAAVISAIHDHDDPEMAARNLISNFGEKNYA